MIPIYKLISVLMRVFSRPMIAMTKRYHAASSTRHPRVRGFFFRTGQFYHHLESYINRTYIRTATQPKPLSQSMAVDRGIEFFYQIVFYSIAIGFPIYELYRAAVDTKAKDVKMEQRLTRMDEKFERIHASVSQIELALQ